MLKMIKGRIKSSGLLQADVTADVNSASFDLQNFNSLMLLINIGSFAFDASNKVAIKVEHSDDNSSFSAVDSSELDAPESSNIVKTVDSTSEDDICYEAHYRGQKRYVRVALDITGTVDFAAAVTAIGGHPELMPSL